MSTRRNMENKTITFGADLNPNGDLDFNLGKSNARWNIFGDLTGNAATATKISVTLDTTHTIYLVGVKTAPTDTATHLALTGDTGVYLTTTAGQLSAKSYSVHDGTNQKVRLEWNSTDSSLDFIFS